LKPPNSKAPKKENKQNVLKLQKSKQTLQELNENELSMSRHASTAQDKVIKFQQTKEAKLIKQQEELKSDQNEKTKYGIKKKKRDKTNY